MVEKYQTVSEAQFMGGKNTWLQETRHPQGYLNLKSCDCVKNY